jgi:hypothetical protein
VQAVNDVVDVVELQHAPILPRVEV